jgi:uncharacterized coiled-coil protein SlyX
MKKAVEIETEIDKTDSRITELETQLSEQTTTFEGVQQAFIAGKSDIDRLHAEQSKLTLISQAIEALKATCQRLKSAFEKQSAQEKRTELLKRMTTSANAVEPLVDDYLKTRNEFHEIVADYAEKLINKAETYRKKQIEYRAIVGELKPTAAEIQESGLAQMTRTMAEATYFNHPPLEYGEAIHIAENQLAVKLNRAAQAKRTAEFNEERAANQQKIKAQIEAENNKPKPLAVTYDQQ